MASLPPKPVQPAPATAKPKPAPKSTQAKSQPAKKQPSAAAAAQVETPPAAAAAAAPAKKPNNRSRHSKPSPAPADAAPVSVKPTLTPKKTSSHQPAATLPSLSSALAMPSIPASPQLQQQQENSPILDLEGSAPFVFGSRRKVFTGQQQQQQQQAQGLEMSQEEINLQLQIQALQNQQKNLLAQQFNMQAFQNTNQSANLGPGHRRIQSQQVMQASDISDQYQHSQQQQQQQNMLTPQQFGLETTVPQAALQQLQPVNTAKGHNRRHSLQVPGANTMGSFSFPANKATNNNNVSNPDAGSVIYEGTSSNNNANDAAFSSRPERGHHRRTSGGGSMSIDWRNNPPAPGNAQPGPDLAQAQAQLASLASFRQAAGAGGHARAASFVFSNMMPNLMEAALMGGMNGGMTSGPGLGASQQQHAFQLQIQHSTNGPQRKSLFAPYLPLTSLPPLLTAGKLVVGILRVNKRNRSDAYVSNDVLEADIYICGSKDRNRALEGDLVAVELLNVDEVWTSKREKEDKKRRKEESSAFESVRTLGAAVAAANKMKDGVEVEGQGLSLIEDEEVNEDTKPQYAGHVVAVVERTPGQLFSGTIGLLRPSSAVTKEKQDAERRERDGGLVDREAHREIDRPKIVWFRPTDKRVPLIAIPTEQAPDDFLTHSDKYIDRLFVSSIKRWPITSLHPFGTLVEDLGVVGDVEVETSALLKDANAAPSEVFNENVLKCLPTAPWIIPDREFETRKDLRKTRVFSVDPPNTKDVDDCISVVENPDGTFAVGVHIADVSHFVKANTALDREARKRATTIHLVQRMVPMLPELLSEDLCSLLPNQDRLAFSVVFTLSREGNVISTWMGKTIVRSSARLSYTDARDVIDGSSLKSGLAESQQLSESLSEDMHTLQGLAYKLRQKRVDNGSLRIESSKLAFTLDANGLPIDCTSYFGQGGVDFIEEFNILSNMAVAAQIALIFPEQALLRRHETPIPRRMEVLAHRAACLGFEIDISSASSLQKTINDIQDLESSKILQTIAVRSIPRARYICAGAMDIIKYKHYALNIPLYTHFTSPIRRYADLIVHRQLEAALAGAQDGEIRLPGIDRDNVAKTAQQCNIKREAATIAHDASAHLFLCLLITDLTERYGPVIRPARVIGILDSAYDVIVTEFGLEKRVHVDQIPISASKHDEKANALELDWQPNVNVIDWLSKQQRDDNHLSQLVALKQKFEGLTVTAPAQNADDLFSDDEVEEGEIEENGRSKSMRSSEELLKQSQQHQKSRSNEKLVFCGLDKTARSNSQVIHELDTVNVVITADMKRSPPVIRVIAVNPFQ